VDEPHPGILIRPSKKVNNRVAMLRFASPSPLALRLE
jgi:hypothetical protein